MQSNIDGVVIRELTMFSDARGTLTELFRSDDCGLKPEMGYVSMTMPGASRGPHEHRKQTDRFIFLGSAQFLIVLWDARKESSTYKTRMQFRAPLGKTLEVVVPPGVVHGYKCIGIRQGMVINLPDMLYCGPGKSQIPDEIRHEEIGSLYSLVEE